MNYNYLKALIIGNTLTTTIWDLRSRITKKNSIINYIRKVHYYRLIERHNSFVPLEADFKDQPTFPHGINGVFISAGASIGRNCTIFHQVTIGSNMLTDSKNYGAPTIGDNVYIGCGAKIIGNCKIGNNVRIGANCVITFDVEDNCTIVLDHPRVIKHSSIKNNTFVNYSGNTK